MTLKKILKEKILPVEANRYSKLVYVNLLLNNVISRCSIAATTRKINPVLPATWEFSGFSQNGEDGIIEHLISGLKTPNKYFIEIGSGNGLENNTGYLAHIKKYMGLQIEGSSASHEEALLIKPWLIECLNCFVNEKTATDIFQKVLFKDPDVFSIDIDGNDFHIIKILLEAGLRPKIIIVEYNSAFGPEKSITIPYKPDFDMFETAHPYLYYGVSINGWKNLFIKYGYQFITTETNGVNAFFINVIEFTDGFTDNVQSIEFKENIHQLRLFKMNCEGQFDKIKELAFVNID